MSKRHILTALVLPVLMAAFLLHACGGKPDAAPAEEPGERTAAADFSLSDLQGKTHRLSDYRGKVVVLNFWDTWCPPCRQEIPGFIALQKELGADGLQLLGVALGQEGVARVKDYTAEAGINYPVLLFNNDAGLLASYGGINSIPVTFVIDREGYIAEQHRGFLSSDAFAALVRPVLEAGGAKS